MTRKQWMRFFAAATPEQCREMGELLIAQADAGPRDAVREAAMQEAINALPDEHDGGMSAALRAARDASGRCCECGRRDPEKQEMTT